VLPLLGVVDVALPLDVAAGSVAPNLKLLVCDELASDDLNVNPPFDPNWNADVPIFTNTHKPHYQLKYISLAFVLSQQPTFSTYLQHYIHIKTKLSLL